MLWTARVWALIITISVLAFVAGRLHWQYEFDVRRTEFDLLINAIDRFHLKAGVYPANLENLPEEDRSRAAHMRSTWGNVKYNPSALYLSYDYTGVRYEYSFWTHTWSESD
jgi:hypothetical protein